MIKSRKAKGKASVTFTLDPGVGAQTAAVCGEWNDWSPEADVMRRDAEGGFSLTIDLDAGRAYRFRYLLDGERWDNDWAADAYQPNSFGGDDSVVDLTRLVQAAPPAARKSPGKKGPAKKGPAKKEPATEEPATKGPAKKGPAKKEPATEEPATKGPATKGPATEEAATGEAATKAASARTPRKAAAPVAKPARKTTK